MPGLAVVRPADANETAQAWRLAVDADGPVALVLSRQDVPVLEAAAELAPVGVPRGGYVLVNEEGGSPDVVLVATGSEVHVCVAAAALLAERQLRARVVSLPCWEWFANQSTDYRDAVLPPDVPTLSVEAAASFGWDRYADAHVAIDTFGASAPGDVVLGKFGFSPDHVAEQASRLAHTMTGVGPTARR
jgi:transketolase